MYWKSDKYAEYNGFFMNSKSAGGEKGCILDETWFLARIFYPLANFRENSADPVLRHSVEEWFRLAMHGQY